MAEEKTHWKKVTASEYLGAWDVPENGSLILTIAKFTQETVKGTGGKEQKRNILHFKEAVKPMVLNNTNSKVIASIYKEAKMENWTGKQIEVRVEWVEAFGLNTDALRVVKKAPEKPKLEIGSKIFEDAVKYLKQEGASIANIEAKFIVSPAVKKALVDAAATE